MKEASDYLEKILNVNDVCVLALSGGPDSMCLLHLLLELRKRKHINILCVHINHNTRAECTQEYEFVRDFCTQENVTLRYFEIEQYQKGKFTESEARDKRYSFLKQVMVEVQAKFLFTAHHADDLVETIFQRILRGSTLSGYAGIKCDSYNEGMHVIRPLIRNTKKEILEYMDGHNFSYMSDKSNASDFYQRNRIRHNLLPFISQEDEHYAKKFLKFSETLEKSNSIIEEMVLHINKFLIDDGKIKILEFLKLSEPLQEVCLRDYFKNIYQQHIHRINDGHLTIALDFIKFGNKKVLSFPLEKVLRNDGEFVWLEEMQKIDYFCIKLEDFVKLPNGGVLEKISSYTEKSNYEIHLNSKDISLPIYVTTRKPGMKMAVKNLGGVKKISDILINSKIKCEEKDKIPILIDSKGEVLWVVGLKKSKYDLEKWENYDIIFKYKKKEGKDL